MSYINDHLLDGEKVIYNAELSNWAFFANILIGIILTPIVIGIFILIYVYFVKNSTEIAVTNKRIIYKTGFIKRDTVELNIKKIESIQVDQSVWGRMLNHGEIVVSGTGSSHAPIKYIKDPLRLRSQIANVIDKLD